jgi:hypothetical protein
MGNRTAPAASGTSFEGFYRCEWADAVRLAHLLTGVEAVAEDLAQEAFAGVHVVDGGTGWRVESGTKTSC